MANEDFLGKPIDGDITHYTEGQAEQHDPQEFIEHLDALVGNDLVAAVKWEQYTPYFNDGDPCVFGTGEFRIKLNLPGAEEDGDYEDGFVYSYDLYRNGEGVTYKERYENRIYTYHGVDVKEVYDALDNLGKIIAHHQVVLQKKFGDPAAVVYDGNRFEVEFYNHD